MKKAMMVMCVLAALCASGAAKWKNINDKSYLGGEKITEKDLIGKAVIVYYFDIMDEQSIKYLSEIESVWGAFKNKKFMLLGNYVGSRDEEKIKSLLSKNKVSFPVYYKATLDPDPKVGFAKTPYCCVVNHRGVVVYCGANIKEMQAKGVEALSVIGMPVSLCGDVTFKKFKGLANQIKLGRNVTSIVKKLDREAKDKDPNVSAEAQEILSAIDMAKDAVKSDIEMYSEVDPEEAIKIIQMYIKTWPKDDATPDFKKSIKDLKKAAKEMMKAEKEKGK